MYSFEELLATMTLITAAEIEDKIDSNQDFVMFIGRISCPFCHLFVPKIVEVADEDEFELFHLDSEDFDHWTANKEFRNKYDIPTVPGLMVVKNGTIKVKCDSKMTKEEIREFIG
ncbi:TPA: thioredoxin domain-containing protein [Streptococcus agalactiae]